MMGSYNSALIPGKPCNYVLWKILNTFSLSLQGEFYYLSSVSLKDTEEFDSIVWSSLNEQSAPAADETLQSELHSLGSIKLRQVFALCCSASLKTWSPVWKVCLVCLCSPCPWDKFSYPEPPHTHTDMYCSWKYLLLLLTCDKGIYSPSSRWVLSQELITWPESKSSSATLLKTNFNNVLVSSVWIK